jgi:hypothetical protein
MCGVRHADVELLLAHVGYSSHPAWPGLAPCLPMQWLAHWMWTRNMRTDSTGEPEHCSTLTGVSLLLYHKLGSKYR